MADEEKETQEEPRKGMSVKIKLIGLTVLVVVLAAAGFGGWKYYDSQIRTETKKQAVAAPVSAIWSAGTLIVNLMDDKGERYLKAGVQVEVSSEDCLAELEELKPKVTDGILVLLSSKSYGDIASLDGKQRLRDEIAVRLNGYMTSGQVRKVYFTEFLIQ